jgi:multisubunit Na+/H+ antiporter MnhG subunit
MNAQTVLQIGLVFLVSAIAVLAFSIYRSSHGIPSTGLSSLGTVLLVLGIGIRMSARKGQM